MRHETTGNHAYQSKVDSTDKSDDSCSEQLPVIKMPIYEYQASGDQSCTHCEKAFDVMQKLADAPLKYCPECHNPVMRKISRPNLARPTPSLSKENIEKHGLTQFKKVEKGVYEKTAGKGPDFITDSEDP